MRTLRMIPITVTLTLLWTSTIAQTWQRLVLPPGNPASAVNGIAVGSTGTVAIVGFYSSPFADTVRFGNGVEVPFSNAQNIQGFLASYSNTDQAQWAIRMGGDFCQANARGLARDMADNVYVGGGYGGVLDLGNGVTLPATPMVGICGCNSADGFVAKIAADGTAIWATAIGGADHGCEDVQEIVVTPAGEVIGVLRLRGSITLNGSTHTTDGSTVASNNDALVFKLDADGNALWSTLITGSGEEYLNGLSLAPNGDLLVAMKSGSPQLTCGSLQITLAGAATIEDVLWKLSSEGVPLWAVALADDQNVDAAFGPDPHLDVQPAVTTDLQNGNVYLTGSYSAASSMLRIIQGDGSVVQVPRNATSNGFLPYLLAFNSSGQLQWNELSQNSTDRVIPYTAAALPNGGLLIGGAFRQSSMSWLDLTLPSLAPFPTLQNTIFVVAVDQNGNAIGEKRGYIGPEGEINNMVRGADGSVYCAGRACYGQSGNTIMDGLVVPLNSLGALANLFYAVLDADPVLQVGTPPRERMVQCYPNPVQDRLTVVSTEVALSAIELLDMAGRSLVVQRPTGHQWTMELDALTAGAYLLRISTGAERHTRIIVKH